ncbi:hypothetical protein [Paenibacillus pini]|uniref:Uncharacterized protein n=1 Tax=Paenibacillus pini JCM 16418 TaxID=1236976 RepID=W7YQF3_9BACL|nr:hypothetical protein [Paenibacillus pini]GAF06821.1 hypothetical protein JCM16418_803 [Paenibacillus pini JCM 16418]
MATISKEEARRRAEKNWPTWRLLLSDINISYSDLDTMSHDDVAEANAALDIHIENTERQIEEAKKGS